MGNVKGIERAELHKTIWRIANDLRGSVNGWDFKSYVSVLHRGGAEFVRSGNKNKLTEENRRRILDAFTARKDIALFARLVENAEIARIVARQVELRTAIDAVVADAGRNTA
jgi:type I restriction-modification system DNA methylase subunit